jgi:diguanylate cyclase (GGDEF)-like protein/PAS domain S-box-containing protein
MNEKYEYIINHSRDFITLINRAYVYEVVNQAYCKVLEKNRAEILNRSVTDVWGREKFTNTIKKHLDTCFTGREVHYIDKFKFGPFEKHMHVSYSPYYTDREITHALVFSHDITQISEIESKLTNYEYRDPITGLFNRRSLNVILEKEIEKAKRSRTESLRAVLFIHVENLNTVNRSYGHHIGDLLLENTGLQITKTVRNSDYVFRFEGNDLTVLLTNIKRNTDAAKVARNIISNVSVPYRYNDDEIFVNCHIGISVYPDDGREKSLIIRNAASALDEARKRKEGFLLYNDSLHRQAVARISMESDLHKAFDGKQFRLHYQPIVDPEGRILGAEALIRWHHPSRGLIMPMDFIPLAEESGIILSIGKWVLYTATQQLAQWASRYSVYASVNLSAAEFLSDELVEVVDTAMKNAGNLSPKHLKLELTETESMGDPEATIRKMQLLTDKGVDIFIDDFGTGHSSLMYLRRLPAKVLKIDKVFIDNVLEDPRELVFLKNILDIAKSRDRTPLVEGVSHPRQVELLREIGCAVMQGYYFSKPVPAERFTEYLRSGAPLPIQT